jgi:hypothetical protein
VTEPPRSADRTANYSGDQNECARNEHESPGHN